MTAPSVCSFFKDGLGVIQYNQLGSHASSFHWFKEILGLILKLLPVQMGVGGLTSKL